MNERKNDFTKEQIQQLEALNKERIRRGQQIPEPPKESSSFDGEYTKKYDEINQWFYEERKKILGLG